MVWYANQNFLTSGHTPIMLIQSVILGQWILGRRLLAECHFFYLVLLRWWKIITCNNQGINCLQLPHQVMVPNARRIEAPIWKTSRDTREPVLTERPSGHTEPADTWNEQFMTRTLTHRVRNEFHGTLAGTRSQGWTWYGNRFEHFTWISAALPVRGNIVTKNNSVKIKNFNVSCENIVQALP